MPPYGTGKIGGMEHPASTLISWAVPPLARWFWSESKDILDRKLVEPPVTLNRRKGANAGKGRGFRSQPDPNPSQFRKYDAVIPRFMN
jgi:hypothetical protein